MLLQGEGDINAATREDSESAPIDDDGIAITRSELRYNDSKTTRLPGPTASLLSCLRPEAMSW